MNYNVTIQLLADKIKDNENKNNTEELKNFLNCTELANDSNILDFLDLKLAAKMLEVG